MSDSASGSGSGPASDAETKLTTQCPACGKAYHVSREQIGQRARCTCGQVFDIVVAGAAAAPPPGQVQPAGAPVAAVAKCVHHPLVDAAAWCVRCRAPICTTCAFPQANGTYLCPTCATAAAPPAAMPGAYRPTAYGPGGYGPAAYGPAVYGPPAGTMCRDHPAVPAVVYCLKCKAPICATCDFVFPGNVHLCPTCATQRPTGLGKRKARVYWSLGLAIWCTAVTLLFFLAAAGGAMEDPEAAAVLGMVVWVVAGIPSIVGLALGISAKERGMVTPPIIYVAAIWNGVIVAVWVLMMIAGLAMSGG